MGTEGASSPRLAARMAEIQPFHVMRLLARARELERQGRDIVHMEIGEPDFTAPEAVVEAGVQALRDGRSHYTPASGLTELREALADYYRRQYAVGLDARRILVTPGASGALQLLLGILLDPGDEVLMADPGYPCNRNFVRLYEGRARPVPVGPETRYQLTEELLRAHWSPSTRVVMLASPANPTGTWVAEDDLRAMAALCAERGAALVVDEIYHGLLYPPRWWTAACLAGEIFVINSFSKYFAMTGWRLGWLVAPMEYVEALERLAQNLFLAPPTPAQYAALAALDEDNCALLERRREIFRQRRDYLLPALRRLGFEIACEPDGAFYIYADCSHLDNDSFILSRQLMEQAGVVVTPGIDFGHHRADQHLRFAYTTSLERLREGVARMTEFFG